MKIALTDRAIKAMRAADKAYDVHDAIVPGLSLSVLPSGLKRFVLLTRFPGSRHPTRRVLGPYGVLTLEAARGKARTWLELIGRGIDPAQEAERQQREQVRKQRVTFAGVARDYLQQAVVGHDPEKPNKRTAGRMRGIITDILIPLFGDRPIAEITADDLMRAFDSVARVGTDRALIKLGARRKLRRRNRNGKPSPEQARALFTFSAMIFNWALDHDLYGLERNPLERVNKARRLGTRARRDRMLTDEELAALVMAIERTPAPFRQAYQTLLHSGLRLKEAAQTRWSEIEGDTWTIPAARMKGKNAGASQAKPHTVPLTETLQKIFAGMPRGVNGDYVFSRDGGASPVSIGSNRFKDRLDAEMLGILRQAASARGENPDRVKLEPWRNHDVRRTCRSTLSRLRITEDVAEAILAHQRPGVTGVYDRWHRLPEKREALEAWSAFLADLVRPRPIEAGRGTVESLG
jgi:integrase